MESRAQWAAKLLQEFQRRVEDMGIPGPHTESNVSAKDSPAKKAKGKLSLSLKKIREVMHWFLKKNACICHEHVWFCFLLRVYFLLLIS